MTVESRRGSGVSRACFAVCAVVGALALGILASFVVENDLFASREQEAVAEYTDVVSTEATAVVPTADPEEEKKAAQQAFEEYVLSVEPDFEFAHFTVPASYEKTGNAVLDEANLLAAGYDYDGAIEKIKTITGYGNIQIYKDAIASYQARKLGLTVWEIRNNITHIFFHSLIVNPGITFDPEITGYKLSDYNSAMTTVDEFVAAIEEMYLKGYVLVDIYDVAKLVTQPDGTEKMVYQEILLPDNKTPFILSIDDTNYYEYMTGQGFATKLIVTDEGKVQNTYTLTNGEEIVGSFDVITILEDFIETHPDFAYRGARGIAGITGYNGVLGYRTSNYWYDEDCEYFEHNEINDTYFREEILSGYNENIEQDKITATEVANAIKAMNWHFASHSWGHKRLGVVSMETMEWDSDMWQREVEPILGHTDLLIFPYGNDFGQTVSWKEYEYEGVNERYRLMREYGFRYFFNVDSAVYFMQRTDEYFRQGRRNIDGERLWESVRAQADPEKQKKDRLADLFTDTREILDPLRPEIE